MIYLNECQRFNKNNPGMLPLSIDIELEQHNGYNCFCSSKFGDFMERHKLGKKPITTEELIELKKAL